MREVTAGELFFRLGQHWKTVLSLNFVIASCLRHHVLDDLPDHLVFIEKRKAFFSFLAQFCYSADHFIIKPLAGVFNAEY